MKVFSKGLFTFLVILVGYNAAQAFGGTGVNGAIIAALFLLGYNPLQPPVTTPVFTISLVCPSIRAAILSAC
ncbi:N-acetylmuramic acid-specific PTS system EIIBC component [Escherichia coli]|uniref:N-acetylmuramic acid-specific PTS system EIIBC component n=1 Tax=Escherichia coli TaxID=562 RepID=A0A2X3LUD7_ECOLX|nr:N-acetylmuramic acid-specific PTS system EIIBC component [Escherichia coli]